MTADLAGLYAEHQPAALRLARALAPASEAEDLVAGSFANIAELMNRQGHAAPREFKPYLMTTVRHQAASAARGRHRLVLIADPEPPAAPGADELAARRDEAGRARRAFASLDRRWQDVLWAVEVEGRRPAELAGRFGLSPNGVAQLAVRAREGLRQAYLAGHAGDIPGDCRPFADLLPAGTRGRLGPRQQARLSRHLRGCARCSALSGELTALNENLGTLIGPGALAAGSVAAGRRLLGSLLHQPAAVTFSSIAVAAAALTATVPLTVTSTVPAPVQARVQTVARAGDHPLSPARPYVPKHARNRHPGGSPGSGSAVPPGGQAVPQAGQAASRAVSGVTATAAPVASAAGQAVTSAGQQLGTAVSGVTGTAGQAAGSVIPAAAPAGQLVTQAGSDLGSDVTTVTGQAGQLAQGAVSGPPGQLVTQAGQDLGADVTTVTGQAGQLVSGTGTAVSGIAGSLPGGL